MVQYMPPIADEHWYESEINLREVVDLLDDEWVCFHHIRFLKPPNEKWGGRNFGEIDFLLAHPTYGLFGIEAKGGRYYWDQTSLKTVDGKVIDPDPITQAVRAKSFFLDRIKRKPEIGFVPWNVFAAFPNMEAVRPFGPTGFEDAIVWKTDITDLQKFLDRILTGRHTWDKLPATRKRSLQLLQGLIMSERQVPSLGRRVKETAGDVEIATTVMLNLNEEQMNLVRDESRHLRTVTSGRAGTGKTTLATQRSRQLAIAGYKVLFFTPNVYLSTSIRETFRAADLLRRSAEDDESALGFIDVISLDAVARTPEDLLRASEELANRLIADSSVYDALIIDECQDVTANLFDALSILLEKESLDIHVHAFGDKAQATSLTDPWLPGPEFNVMALVQQCRCSEPIQRVVDHAANIKHRPNGIVGPAVELLRSTGEPLQIVDRMLSYRDQQGMDLADITPLVLVPDDSEREIELTTAIERAVAQKKVVGSRVSPKTADQFKGCESTAVVLWIEGTNLDEHMRRYIYMTASRAKAHLTIIASEQILDFVRGAIPT